MYYLVIDLEWNNTYGRKTKTFINEIIEIGAIMLDDNLCEISRYSSLIKAQIGKKLRGSVKQLTHITNEDLQDGIPFTKVMSELKKWIGGREAVIISWGDGDIRVMIENLRYLSSTDRIPFLSYYADLQSYFQHVMGTSPANQMSLGGAAQMLGIDTTDASLHRAVDDCAVTAECLRRLYPRGNFEEYVKKCDDAFYGKLSFKPYFIGNINNPLVDKSKLFCTCEQCGKRANQMTEWKYSCRHFRAIFYCARCDIRYRMDIGFRKLYDRVEVKKKCSVIKEQDENKSAAQGDAPDKKNAAQQNDG